MRTDSVNVKSFQQGSSLIEVLISILILAVGILGMGGLQLTSLQSSSDSVLRTQAVYMSYEILDRIRANSTAAMTAIKNTSVELGEPSVSESCVTGTCTAAELFAFDILEWKCSLGKYSAAEACKTIVDSGGSLVSLESGLPEGDGSIIINSDNSYTITIQWVEDRDANAEIVNTTQFELKGVL